MCYLLDYICNWLDVKEYTHSVSLRSLAAFEQFERARKAGKTKPGGTWEPVVFVETTEVNNSSNTKSRFELPLVHTCTHTRSVT